MTTFQLIYYGNDLENHDISTIDLTTGLVAINNILERADYLINQGKTKTEVRVQASFETGSFKVNFHSIQSLLNKTVDLFSSQETAAVVNAFTILGIIGAFIKLIKFLDGKRPTKIISNQDGSFRVYKGEKYIKAEKHTIQLYKDYKLNQSFQKLIEPLQKDGIESVAIIRKNQEIYDISKNEMDYFNFEPDETSLDNQVFITNINIINLSFKEGNKWYINDGTTSYYVIVEDEEFIKQINESKIKFAKSDIFQVRIRREQYQSEQKLKNKNFIEKVIKQRIISNSKEKFLFEPKEE